MSEHVDAAIALNRTIAKEKYQLADGDVVFYDGIVGVLRIGFGMASIGIEVDREMYEGVYGKPLPDGKTSCVLPMDCNIERLESYRKVDADE